MKKTESQNKERRGEKLNHIVLHKKRKNFKRENQVCTIQNTKESESIEEFLRCSKEEFASSSESCFGA